MSFRSGGIRDKGGIITQEEVLEDIRKHEPCTIQEINDRLGCRGASISCMRLEKWGYIRTYFELAITSSGRHVRMKKIVIQR